MISRRRWASRGASWLIFAAALALGSQPLQAGTIYVQPIQVCDSGGNNCGDAPTTLFEQATEKIWTQAGISIDFLTTEIADTTGTGALDVNSNTILTELFGYGLYPAGTDPLFNSYPSYAGNLVVSMWFVPAIDYCGTSGEAYGCGEQPGNEIAIANNVFTGNRLDTMGHEIGHNLGLSHCEDAPAQCNSITANYWLMDAGGDRDAPSSLGDITPDGQQLDRLSLTEIGIAQDSPLDQAPEPGTILLTGIGILGLAFAGRRVGQGSSLVKWDKAPALSHHAR